MGSVARQGSPIGSCGIGGKGRVARQGSDIGSGGVGGEGRVGPGSGARSDRDGSAVSKSGEIRAEAEGGLRDRTGWASAWRASGEGRA